jgi:ubiquinone/menaquinone biosynthesis C-methylase UbiE
VTGVDISDAMIRSAQQHTMRGSCFLVADAHALPFATGAFDLAFAVFAFNETDPAAAFAEVRRVLKPGGRLALLEWGPVDWLTALLDETLATHATETASGFQAEMRALTATHRPWDDAVSNCDDIQEILQDAGFVNAACEFVRAAVTFAVPDDFINYALAWAPRRVEVDAMSPDARDCFFCELRSLLGKPPLIWRPRLFYAAAAAPASA